MVYESIKDYLGTATTRETKLAKVEEIQLALLDAMLVAATDGHVESYQLNDGQTTINARHRTPEDMQRSYNALENIKHTLINQGTGRIFRAHDSKNFG